MNAEQRAAARLLYDQVQRSEPISKASLATYLRQALDALEAAERDGQRLQLYRRVANDYAQNEIADRRVAERERDKLRAELGRDGETMPCGHARHWQAARNPADAKSEWYCLFCEVARLQDDLASTRRSHAHLCKGIKAVLSFDEWGKARQGVRTGRRYVGPTAE